MKITKISYQKAFVVGPYLQEKIGFEAEPEPYIGCQYDGPNGMEKYDEVLTTLEKMADEWHKKAHPHLYQQEGAPEIVRSFTPQQTGPSVAVIDYKEKENLEIAIDNATSLEDLAKLKEQAGKQGLIHPYMQKMNELMSTPVNFSDDL
jgi:hypothetical protein